MVTVPPDIAGAAERLRAGGIVAFPTETVYGLGADALREDAVARVFALKRRPINNPLIVHVCDETMARSCASAWPHPASRLASAFWPGPLSIVVPKAPHIPAIVTAGGSTVALRCPDHPVALALIAAFGGPIVGPSANPSGFISPTTAAHVRDAFSPDDVLVLDGGPCRTGIESTVVAIEHGCARILRPGVIGADAIAATLDGAPVITGEESAAIARSPGLIGPHYAPRARVILFNDDTWPTVAAEVRTRLDSPSLIILSRSPRTPPPGAIIIPMPKSAGDYARHLYAALRKADALNPSVIAVELPARDELNANQQDHAVWTAVLDRLTRAAKDPDDPVHPDHRA